MEHSRSQRMSKVINRAAQATFAICGLITFAIILFFGYSLITQQMFGIPLDKETALFVSLGKVFCLGGLICFIGCFIMIVNDQKSTL